MNRQIVFCRFIVYRITYTKRTDRSQQTSKNMQSCCPSKAKFSVEHAREKTLTFAMIHDNYKIQSLGGRNEEQNKGS